MCVNQMHSEMHSELIFGESGLLENEFIEKCATVPYDGVCSPHSGRRAGGVAWNVCGE